MSGTGDGTVVPADVRRVVAAKYPPVPRGGSQLRFGAVHISVGALLRAELQRHQAGHGHRHTRTAEAPGIDAFRAGSLSYSCR